jgi:hypothetical protein
VLLILSFKVLNNIYILRTIVIGYRKRTYKIDLIDRCVIIKINLIYIYIYIYIFSPTISNHNYEYIITKGSWYHVLGISRDFNILLPFLLLFILDYFVVWEREKKVDSVLIVHKVEIWHIFGFHFKLTWRYRLNSML